MAHVIYHLLRLAVAKVVCLEQADAMLSTDAAALVFYVVENKGLKLLLYFLCCFQVIVTLHHRVQMQVAISNVAVAEHSAA